MEKNKMSVFKWPCGPRYYLLRPWKWFNQLFDNIRAGWRRANKGYCYSDVWNLCDWFLEVMPSMLNDLAEKGCAYPGNDNFPDAETWETWLKKISNNLIYCREEEREKRNEYEKEFLKTIGKDKKINDLYFGRAEEIFQESQTLLNDTFSELSKNFYSLWD